MKQDPLSNRKKESSVPRLPRSIAYTPCILVVEDHRDSSLLIAQLLEALNYVVLTAADGVEALSLAIAYCPDLILLDIILPKLNGIELLYLLKENRLTRNIPIVAVTGLAFDQERDEILKAGCDDYLAKPFWLDELEAVIHRHLTPEQAPLPVPL